MSEQGLQLASEFPAVGYDDWLKVVEPVLKGAPFEKKLVHRSYEGIAIRPLYTDADWPAATDAAGFPGAMPLTRGSRPQGRPAGWDIRQGYAHPDPAVVNRELALDLARGAGSATVRVDDAEGVIIADLADLDRLFAGIDLARVPVALSAGAAALPAAAALMALWRRRGITAPAAGSAFNADPLGTLAATGRLPVSRETALADLAALAAHTARHWPGVFAVGVDTAPYHGAGAHEAQDLACALATAVAYLRAMTAGGLGIDDACRQILFTLPVGCDQFLGIAKLRAARRLWAQVTAACGASEPARAMALHARTADIMMTRRDPWVNILRTTVACFAAAVGGADAITVQPLDAALGLPDDLARRLARNTQIMLAEESSLYRVIDPAGGAWFVERLTDELSAAAWAAFQEIEAAGGMAAALGGGLVAERIGATWAERSRRLATRREPLTGVSEYPNVYEAPVSPPVPVRAAVRGADGIAPDQATGIAADRIGGLIAAAGEGAGLAALGAALAGTGPGPGPGAGTVIGALPRHRFAEAFEALRDAADAIRARSGVPPRIFLANLGPVAQHTARATFAKNFFEAGGIEAVMNDGFADAESCAAAFRASGAMLAVVCSSDDVCAALVPSVAPALKAAGARTVYLAGQPGAQKEAWRQAGVDAFIHAGGDLLVTLRAALSGLGA